MQQHRSLVSSIIIFLNAERFIEEAIESIFAQSYPKWELLLVDDGSTDRSRDIALNYARKYPGKVSYLEHPNHQNRGMSAARNLGLKHAQGEYIAFLDADDVWLPEKLEQQVAIMDEHPEAGMVYGKIFWWYGWTGKPEDLRLDFLRNILLVPNKLYYPPQLCTLFLEDKIRPPGMGCNPLIRKELFTRIGYYEEGFRGMYEDIVMFSKIVLNAPVYVSDRYWAKYRQHADSCSSINHDFSKNIDKICSSRLKYLNWLQRYIDRQNIKHVRISIAILKELWFYRYPSLVLLWRQLSDRIWSRERGKLRTKIARRYNMSVASQKKHSSKL